MDKSHSQLFEKRIVTFLKIKDGINISKLSREADIGKASVFKNISIFRKLGLIYSKKKGRTTEIYLTEKGLGVYKNINNICFLIGIGL